MYFDEPKIIIHTHTGKRNPTTAEAERLRGYNWSIWKKGQKLYGSKIPGIFENYNKQEHQVHIKELTVDEYNNWIPPVFVEEKKYTEAKAVDLNTTEAQRIKNEKIAKFKSLFDEFVKTPEFKKLSDSGFRTKFTSGSGIYFQSSSRNNPNLVFNILIESGYVSFMEYSQKHKAEVRKYQLIRTGVMELPDLLKSVEFIINYSV